MSVRGDGFPVREERLMNVMAHRLAVEKRYSLGSSKLWESVFTLLRAQGLVAGRSSEGLRKHHQRNTERCIVCNPYSGDELPSTWSLVRPGQPPLPVPPQEHEPSVDIKEDFSLSCNVQGYRADELRVDLQGDQLMIQGEHQHNGERRSVHRTFKRKVALPENVQKDTVQCSMDKKGRLQVRAQNKALEQEQFERNIPIRMQ
ncbi:hsp20/alpha crystallin family domain-containing protein [Ditylenchus destructor]|nr:hsp20/alpha crystallin family domain-containing protein [Ditylenchus destructor]